MQNGGGKGFKEGGGSALDEVEQMGEICGDDNETSSTSGMIKAVMGDCARSCDSFVMTGRANAEAIGGYRALSRCSDWQEYGKPSGLEGKSSKGRGQGRHLAILEKPLLLTRVSRV